MRKLKSLIPFLVLVIMVSLLAVEVAAAGAPAMSVKMNNAIVYSVVTALTALFALGLVIYDKRHKMST